MSKGLQIALGALAIAGLLGWYGYSQLGREDLSFQYFQTLDEFHQNAPEMLGPSGPSPWLCRAVVDRARRRRAAACASRCRTLPPHAGGPVGQTLSVDYGSLETPDLFKDGAEVVVEGELETRAGETVFVARNVMAKCPSKFQAQTAPADDASIEL